MKPVLTILNKVFVQEFYRSNASFFLVVLGLAGGFMRSYDHIALAEYFTSSIFLLLIPILFWTLYTVKVIRFNLDLLKRGENEFIYSISLLPQAAQWLALIGTLSAQLIPMIFYGLFLVLTAWKNNMMGTLALTTIACLLLIILSSSSLFIALRHPAIQKTVWALTRFINTTFAKPYPLFFPEWIIRREAWMVIGTKLFSGLVLYGIIQLYKTDEYDLRLFGMGVVLAFSANVNITWEMHRFDNFHLDIIRNLPMSYLQRLGYFTITLSILILPEAGMIIKNFPSTFTTIDLISTLLFGLSIPFLFYGCLYRRHMEQEQLMAVVFFVCIGLIVLILFKIPLFILGMVNLFSGLLIWRKYYYFFEYYTKS